MLLLVWKKHVYQSSNNSLNYIYYLYIVYFQVHYCGLSHHIIATIKNKSILRKKQENRDRKQIINCIVYHLLVKTFKNMSVDIKKMTMKITINGSGQVCVTDPILLLSSSSIEEKRILYQLVQKNNFIFCYYHYSFKMSQWEGCPFEIWKNDMDRQKDLTPCVYGYNFLGPHNLLTSHPMQAFIGKCILVVHASTSSHIVCGSGS